MPRPMPTVSGGSRIWPISPSAFDDLARSLAQPTSRRGALRIMGAAALAATVPALRPARARATPPDCRGKCSGNQGTLCQFDLPTCTPYVCCPAPYVCCAGPASATCCKPGCTCGDDGRGFKACQNCPRCDPGQTECGKYACCKSGETCAQKGGFCCPDGKTACGNKCCDRHQRCANAAKGVCETCAKGREACGKTCCPATSYCCNEQKGLCCDKKRGACCNTARGWGCCNHPNVCVRLADESGTLPKGAHPVCCPEGRVVRIKGVAKSCCPPGYVTLGGKLVVSAGLPGGGGLCCREDKVCGSGKDVTCCGSEPGFVTVCRDGQCVTP
jgi:hypothetical protein